MTPAGCDTRMHESQPHDAVHTLESSEGIAHARQCWRETASLTRLSEVMQDQVVGIAAAEAHETGQPASDISLHISSKDCGCGAASDPAAAFESSNYRSKLLRPAAIIPHLGCLERAILAGAQMHSLNVS